MTPYHHGNLRETLLAEARRQLIEQGPEKLSLRALARSAEVSQTAPYRHFPDKKALLVALATQGFDEFSEKIASAVAVSPAHGGEEPLVELALAYIDFARNNPELYKLMFGPILTEKDQYPELKAAGMASIAHLRNALAGSLPAIPDKDKGCSEERLWNATLSCWSLVHGLASLYLAGLDMDCPETGTRFDLREGIRMMSIGLTSNLS